MEVKEKLDRTLKENESITEELERYKENVNLLQQKGNNNVSHLNYFSLPRVWSVFMPSLLNLTSSELIRVGGYLLSMINQIVVLLLVTAVVNYGSWFNDDLDKILHSFPAKTITLMLEYSVCDPWLEI